MNGNKIFLDTNLIIYFLEANEDFYPKIRTFFLQAENKEITIYTSSLSYLEVLVPVIKNRKIELKAKYDYLFKGFYGVKIIDIDLEVAEIGAFIRAKYNIRTPDALQVACVIKEKCDKFLTADKRLKDIQEIEVEIID